MTFFWSCVLIFFAQSPVKRCLLIGLIYRTSRLVNNWVFGPNMENASLYMFAMIMTWIVAQFTFHVSLRHCEASWALACDQAFISLFLDRGKIRTPKVCFHSLWSQVYTIQVNDRWPGASYSKGTILLFRSTHQIRSAKYPLCWLFSCQL